MQRVNTASNDANTSEIRVDGVYMDNTRRENWESRQELLTLSRLVKPQLSAKTSLVKCPAEPPEAVEAGI